LNRTNYQYEIKANPWSISYKQAIKNKDTCIYSMAYTKERSQLFQWTGELIHSTTSFYSLSAKNITLGAFEDAIELNVAVIKDDVTHHFLLTKGFVEGENLYVLENYDALLSMLDKRQMSIDLVILNDELLKNRVMTSNEKSKYKKHFVIDELKFKFHLACNLNIPIEVVNNLSDSLASVKDDGTYDKIEKKWKSYFSDSFVF